MYRILVLIWAVVSDGQVRSKLGWFSITWSLYRSKILTITAEDFTRFACYRRDLGLRTAPRQCHLDLHRFGWRQFNELVALSWSEWIIRFSLCTRQEAARRPSYLVRSRRSTYMYTNVVSASIFRHVTQWWLQHWPGHGQWEEEEEQLQRNILSL